MTRLIVFITKNLYFYWRYAKQKPGRLLATRKNDGAESTVRPPRRLWKWSNPFNSVKFFLDTTNSNVISKNVTRETDQINLQKQSNKSNHIVNFFSQSHHKFFTWTIISCSSIIFSTVSEPNGGKNVSLQMPPDKTFFHIPGLHFNPH